MEPSKLITISRAQYDDLSALRIVCDALQETVDSLRAENGRLMNGIAGQ